jgi:hypothetical protein
MTIDVPNKCRRMVAAYKALGYALVPSDKRNLLKMTIPTGESNVNAIAQAARPSTIYIIASMDRNGRPSPFCGVSLLNRPSK